MGRVLDGSATTTEAIRRAMQNSQKSLRTLAKRYGLTRKAGANMEAPDVYGRPEDRTERAACDGSVRRGRNHHCGVASIIDMAISGPEGLVKPSKSFFKIPLRDHRTNRL